MFQEVSPRLTLIDNSLSERIIVAEPRFTVEHPVPRCSCLDLSPACPHPARSYYQAEEVRACCKAGRAKREDRCPPPRVRRGPITPTSCCRASSSECRRVEQGPSGFATTSGAG